MAAAAAATNVSGMHTVDDGAIAVKSNRETSSIDDDPVESIRAGFTTKINLTED